MRKFRQIFTLVVVFYLSLITSADSRADDSVLNVAAVGPKTEIVDAGQYSRLIYVSLENGSDKSGDGSKSNPYKTLLSALSRTEIASAESKIAVLVASGTYANGTLIMKEYMDLFGGFDPQTWNRDIDNNQTVLDGDGARRVVLAASHARLDGFIVTNGLSASDGGGILCDDTSPMISNNYIINNAVLEPPDFNHQRIHQEGNHGGGIALIINEYIRKEIMVGELPVCLMPFLKSEITYFTGTVHLSAPVQVWSFMVGSESQMHPKLLLKKMLSREVSEPAWPTMYLWETFRE